MGEERSQDPDLINYTAGVFKSEYEMDDMVFYAMFAPEMYHDEDGLEPTGMYQIVLLHPTGQYVFKMYASDGFWKIDEDKPYLTGILGQGIIQWLGDEIDSKAS